MNRKIAHDIAINSTGTDSSNRYRKDMVLLEINLKPGDRALKIEGEMDQNEVLLNPSKFSITEIKNTKQWYHHEDHTITTVSVELVK